MLQLTRAGAQDRSRDAFDLVLVGPILTGIQDELGGAVVCMHVVEYAVYDDVHALAISGMSRRSELQFQGKLDRSRSPNLIEMVKACIIAPG